MSPGTQRDQIARGVQAFVNERDRALSASKSEQIRFTDLWYEVTGGEGENRDACSTHGRQKNAYRVKGKKRGKFCLITSHEVPGG
jgi:hypothetical protein